MAPKRKGLGRGLDSLIPNKINPVSSNNDEKTSKKTSAKKAAAASNENTTAVNEVTEIDVIPKKNEKESNNSEQTMIVPEDALKLNQEGLQGELSSESAAVNEEEQIETSSKEDNYSENISKDNSVSDNKLTSEDDSEKVLSVKITLVEPNREQPRKKFNEEGIDELASSIAQYGVIQPLLVQWKDNYYEIIAGERRWRAAMKAGLKEIPVIVKEYSNKEAVEISLIENIQREDLNPIEEALAYERLVEEFAMTQEQVAERVSKSRSSVTNSMRLLKLENDVREMIISGDISEGHARTLLSLPSAESQKLIADRIVKEKLSVRDTERLVKKLVSDVKRPIRKRDYEKEAILGNLSEQLKNIFGTKVSISENSKHRGKIEIEYYSDDELNRIFELLQSVR